MNIWASRNDFGSQWELRTHHLVLYDCTCMRRRNVREVHIKHEGRSWGLFPAAKYTLAHMWQRVWILSPICNRLIKGSLYEVRRMWRMGLVSCASRKTPPSLRDLAEGIWREDISSDNRGNDKEIKIRCTLEVKTYLTLRCSDYLFLLYIHTKLLKAIRWARDNLDK